METINSLKQQKLFLGQDSDHSSENYQMEGGGGRHIGDDIEASSSSDGEDSDRDHGDGAGFAEAG